MIPGFNPESTSPARRRIDAAGKAFERWTRQQPPPDPALVARVQAAIDAPAMAPMMVPKEVPAHRPPFTPVAAILAIVARDFGVMVIDLRSQRRTQPLVIPRQAAMYLAKRLTLASLQEIGRRIGGRDHTTVLHGFRRTEWRMAGDPAFAAKVERLEAECWAVLAPTGAPQ